MRTNTHTIQFDKIFVQFCVYVTGSEYYRYNARHGRIDPGYPRPLSVWGFPPDVEHIDAALQSTNYRTYFFVNDVYYRYNDQEFRIDDTYPQPTGYWWFGCGDRTVRNLSTISTGGSVVVSISSKMVIVLTTVMATLVHLV